MRLTPEHAKKLIDEKYPNVDATDIDIGRIDLPGVEAYLVLFTHDYVLVKREGHSVIWRDMTGRFFIAEIVRH